MFALLLVWKLLIHFLFWIELRKVRKAQEQATKEALLLLECYLAFWVELRRAREIQGHTAEEAAELLNVDVRTFLSWERGEHQPRALNRLAIERTYLAQKLQIGPQIYSLGEMLDLTE